MVVGVVNSMLSALCQCNALKFKLPLHQRPRGSYSFLTFLVPMSINKSDPGAFPSFLVNLTGAAINGIQTGGIAKIEEIPGKSLGGSVGKHGSLRFDGKRGLS